MAKLVRLYILTYINSHALDIMINVNYFDEFEKSSHSFIKPIIHIT